MTGAALAVASVVAYAVVVERNQFTLREISVPVLDKGSAPIRVLHLSDMHLAPWQRGKARWVAELAGLRPDLVVSTGDNWGAKDAFDIIRDALGPFAGIPGVFVFGSNDYDAPRIKNPFGYFAGPSRATRQPTALDSEGLRSFLTNSLGWDDLNNSATALSVAGRTIEFFGVDDPHHGHDDIDATRDALDSVRGVSGEPSLRIGLTHAPYAHSLAELSDLGADILFAGHTHGGQVCLPGVGALVTNCDLPRAQASGLSHFDSENGAIPLHVSAGLGTSIYAPVRFACPPEATLLTLTARV